jgi:hypothetical protein|eukprot:COSAG02_NODE_72_length_41961_cov_13.243658_20_plen_49_part_00
MAEGNGGGAVVAACGLPCGVVGEGEPPAQRNGTAHVRLDGSHGSDKCV